MENWPTNKDSAMDLSCFHFSYYTSALTRLYSRHKAKPEGTPTHLCNVIDNHEVLIRVLVWLVDDGLNRGVVVLAGHCVCVCVCVRCG
jgi:hypothetical protein